MSAFSLREKGGASWDEGMFVAVNPHPDPLPEGEGS